MDFDELSPIFRDIELIYQSDSSTVCFATHIATNTKVCLKMIQVSQLTESQLQYTKREIRIHRKINHPCIAKFFGMLTINNNTIQVLVLEYVGKTTLLDKLNDPTGITEFEAKKIVCQLTYALYFLHISCNIVHRDLKLENIVYNEDDGSIKLLDFGVSSDCDIMSTKCGSLPYCPPELILGDSYSKEVDIWSAGVVLYSLLTGELPFDDINTQNLIHKIITEEPPQIPFATPESQDLVKKMLDKNPKTRIKIEEILCHEWLNDSDCDAFEQERFFESFDFIRFADISEMEIEPSIVKMIPNCSIESIREQFKSKNGTPQTIHYNIIYWQNKLNHLYPTQGNGMGIACVSSSFMAFRKEEPMGQINYTSFSSRPLPPQTRLLLNPQKKCIPKLESKDRLINQLGLKGKMISGPALPLFMACKCSSGPIFTMRKPSLSTNKKVLIKKQTPLFIPSISSQSDHNLS